MKDTIGELIEKIEPELEIIREEKERVYGTLKDGVNVSNFHYLNSLHMSTQSYLKELRRLRDLQYPIPPKPNTKKRR